MFRLLFRSESRILRLNGGWSYLEAAGVWMLDAGFEFWIKPTSRLTAWITERVSVGTSFYNPSRIRPAHVTLVGTLVPRTTSDRRTSATERSWTGGTDPGSGGKLEASKSNLGVLSSITGAGLCFKWNRRRFHLEHEAVFLAKERNKPNVPQRARPHSSSSFCGRLFCRETTFSVKTSGCPAGLCKASERVGLKTSV